MKTLAWISLCATALAVGSSHGPAQSKVAPLAPPSGFAPGLGPDVIDFEGLADNLIFQEEGSIVCNPCIDITARCEEAGPGEPIPFVGRVQNCGDVDLLNVRVAHDNATPLDLSDDVIILVIPLLPVATNHVYMGSYVPSVPAGQPSTLVIGAIGWPPADCGMFDVLDTTAVTCTQETGDVGEGCTPGFWKNHPELWDEAGDPIAAAAGFTTSTSFNGFFGVTALESGFSDSTTMLKATGTGGGGGKKLARHGVPALLNLAAGLDYDLPDGIADATALSAAIQQAYQTGVFEPLASQLAAANEAGCPF